MDAFGGFVRGTRRKSEELGAVSVEMGAFTSQFSTTSWERILFGPPLWLSPDRCITAAFKTAGLYSRQARFLIGAKATA